MTSTGRYPGFRAPQGDGEILCVPSLGELPDLIKQHRSRSELDGITWSGRPLREIAREGRREILAAAVQYTRQYADVGAGPGPDEPLIVTGHQAELFHPGVWLKNFFAARLAKETGGTAINLIIDSDLCRRTAVRVPTGTGDNVHSEMVPFDKSVAEMPFEERGIADRHEWETFGGRVTGALHRRVEAPMIDRWWPRVVADSVRDSNVGLTLSRARHQTELAWGARSLELPQSRICQTEVFRLFAWQLLMRAEEFREAHNQALHDYRAAHKLKNHAQPMPNLADKDGWIETPFWLWSNSDPRRRGVFVKCSKHELTMSDLNERSLTFPKDEASVIEGLGSWEAQGIKLRTRALATTLFARLLLADLFIHGIGGAKYDQVTDQISEQFFFLTLPRYATVSGTLRLPLSVGHAPSTSERELRQELRNQRFHPERFQDTMNLSTSEFREVATIVADKRAWIETPKTPENAAERHQAISHANERLQSYLSARRSWLEQAISHARTDALTTQLRGSREYAYCLFSENALRAFFKI